MWFASWLLNPAMLAIGALAIASPIIIHLLNRRRFRIVDWAAMDFLFDADKKNRRRIRIENLILLALRCLAMILLGLLLARPFLPSSVTGLLGNSQQFERIFVLDDSLSQRLIAGNQSTFEAARDRLKQMLSEIARDQAEDYLTLYVTSQPDKPLLSNEPVTPETLDALLQTVEEMVCSDRTADYEATLQELQRYLEGQRSSVNRLVYVLTDLRRRDWLAPQQQALDTAPNKLLADIGQSVAECFVVDVGAPLEDNLAIVDIRAEDLLVANTIVRVRVTVANLGLQSADNIQVRFRVEDQQPQTEEIASLGPGQSEAVTFRYLFQYDLDEFQQLDLQEQLDANRLGFRVTAEILQDGSLRDHLIQDSSAFFAARVLRAIPVLIVDGDPSPVPERGESYYLSSIGLPGTGLLVDTATINELETVSLSRYRVIFLCNVDEASPDRLKSLRQWVAGGGGLVLMPGDRVRASAFNEFFFEQGEGLSPIRLSAIDGDPSLARWVYFETIDRQHPALRVTQDREIDLGKVEVFSWWQSQIEADQLDKTVSVQMRLSNEDNSPAMCEKAYGDGKVVAFTIPADGDWTMWPSHPTYVCVMWDLVNYLVGNLTGTSVVKVGSPISLPVDLSRYDLRVTLTDPEEEKVEGAAKPMDTTAESQNSVLYQVRFDSLNERGFYQVNLRRQSGEVDPVLFAANIDPAESDLKRVDPLSLEADFFGPNTRLVSADQLVGKAESRTINEIWLQVLLLLGCVLVVEQLLGWWFGRRR